MSLVAASSVVGLRFGENSWFQVKREVPEIAAFRTLACAKARKLRAKCAFIGSNRASIRPKSAAA